MRCSMTLRRVIGRSSGVVLAVGLMLLPVFALAATSSQSFKVSAYVVAGCTVSADTSLVSAPNQGWAGPAPVRTDCVRNTQAVISTAFVTSNTTAPNINIGNDSSQAVVTITY